MKKGSITLTKEEDQYLNTLSTEEREKYSKEAYMKRVRLMSEISVHSTRIIELCDELESLNGIRGKMKTTARSFLIQINYYINSLFKGGDDPVYGTSWINKKLVQIEEIFSKVEPKRTKENYKKF